MSSSSATSIYQPLAEGFTAGNLCKAPPERHAITISHHSCFNCGRIIQCQMFCRKYLRGQEVPLNPRHLVVRGQSECVWQHGTMNDFPCCWFTISVFINMGAYTIINEWNSELLPPNKDMNLMEQVLHIHSKFYGMSWRNLILMI